MPAADFVSAVGLKGHKQNAPQPDGWAGTLSVQAGCPPGLQESPKVPQLWAVSSELCGPREKDQDTGLVKGTHLQRVLYEMWHLFSAGVPLKEIHAHNTMKRGIERLGSLRNSLQISMLQETPKLLNNVCSSLGSSVSRGLHRHCISHSMLNKYSE